MRNTLPTLAAVGAALLFAGCAGGGVSAEPESTPTVTESASSSSAATPPNAGESPTPSLTRTSEDQIATVAVTIKGSTIRPQGDRVDLAVGEPLEFKVYSDRAGELHVHSSPEQTLKYPKGASTLRLKIGRPGVVDVEDHESGVTIVQLEVR